MSNASPVIVWFRLDLRLADNPALTAAAATGRSVIPLYILDDALAGETPGAASRWWLHHSLDALGAQLRDLGSRLVLRRGGAEEVLAGLIGETGADALFWNRRYEPAAIARDTRIKQVLKERGVAVRSFNSALLFEPWEVETRTGDPYKVFTPFWKTCLAKAEPSEPTAEPDRLAAPANWPRSDALPSWNLLPRIRWDAGLEAAWTPGRAGAEAVLGRFLDEALRGYAEGRDVPGDSGTSRLSPHLHFGEIGPREIWHAVSAEREGGGGAGAVRGSETYLRELGWREFAHHLLFHFPRTVRHPLRPEFERFPWADDEAGLRAWQRGLTGFPIVDAGMRELWDTGWMHNRVRMIAASFLVKDLLVPWQRGADWFWDTLVDADLASNTLGWQWTAGCGADAAPYFRIFNPTSQGERFDPDGTYVRRYVPELAGLPAPWIHRPWEAPEEVLRRAGVELGTTYPRPIVDHAQARDRALEAYGMIR